MNQLMRVNDHVVIWAIGGPVRYDQHEEIMAKWKAMIGPDPMLVIFPETTIVINEAGTPILFQFSGDISPTMVAEFQRWWEAINA